MSAERHSAEAVAVLLREALEKGATVEIDGLGVFRPTKNGFTFLSGKTLPKVFIAYVQEDGAFADRLFDALRENGFDPWLDRRKLLPGQNWPRAIEDAMNNSDFALACFSRNSVNKIGGFQAEIRYALDCACRLPLDDIFLVPLRLDDCKIPERIRRIVQYVDFFPDWQRGFRRTMRVLRAQSRKRKAA